MATSSISHPELNDTGVLTSSETSSLMQPTAIRQQEMQKGEIT